MDGAQLGRRAHVGLTLVTDDLVGDTKLLEQPQHALRTGIVEVMDDEHGLGLSGKAATFALKLVVPAARWKVEMPSTRSFYPDVIDPLNLPGYIFPKSGNND